MLCGVTNSSPIARIFLRTSMLGLANPLNISMVFKIRFEKEWNWKTDLLANDEITKNFGVKDLKLAQTIQHYHLNIIITLLHSTKKLIEKTARQEKGVCRKRNALIPAGADAKNGRREYIAQNLYEDCGGSFDSCWG